MLIKELYCNEAHKDYRVKDPETFHKERAKELRKLKFARVEIDGDTQERPVKVKSARPKKLKWNKDGYWEFKCKIKVEVLD
jgi:hypothetical protein